MAIRAVHSVREQETHPSSLRDSDSDAATEECAYDRDNVNEE